MAMEGRRHPFRIGLPAAASLAVNALLAAVLLSLGMSSHDREPPPAAITVMSFAADRDEEHAEAPQEKAQPTRSAAPSVAARKEPSSPPVADVRPPPVAQAALVVAPAPATGAQPANPAAGQHDSPPAANVLSPERGSPAAARRGLPDKPDAAGPSGDSRRYAALVRSWLYAHKIYPRRARMRREEGVVQVRFIIDRAGMLLEGAIVRGSGNGMLDEEALATLRRASPFPKAPRDVGGERIEFTVPIEFALSA